MIIVETPLEKLAQYAPYGLSHGEKRKILNRTYTRSEPFPL